MADKSGVKKIVPRVIGPVGGSGGSEADVDDKSGSQNATNASAILHFNPQMAGPQLTAQNPDALNQPSQLGGNQTLNLSATSARSVTQPQNEKPNQLDRNMYLSEVTAPGTTELIKTDFKQPDPRLI